MNEHIFWYADVGRKVPTNNSEAAETAEAETCRNLDRRNPDYILPYLAPEMFGQLGRRACASKQAVRIA
jgi:hypothetical protein